ncbi:hypothetical protein [Arthrobacter globiformis]|uniref:hypothetical protein n=1 Tax=Arthrobacter globiformis TaxID=1665 RepID=UPI0027D89761|nr:hypothetical protein [Arthrobacter globiformis]
MGHSTGWLKHHRLPAFFILAYAISWASWPFFAAGLMPRMEFLPVGPLAADMAGNMWFDGFAGPFVADVAPGAILAGGSGMLVVGGLSSYVLFALGWMFFGIAGWLSRMFPAWIGVAFVVAGFLGYNAGLPPYGIPIGLVMAALGWWIIRTGAPATTPSGSTTGGQTTSAPKPSPTARPAARASAPRWRRTT